MVALSKLFSLSTAVRTAAVVGAVVFAVWYIKRSREKIPRVFVCSSDSDWDEIADEFKKCSSEGLLGVDCEWVNVNSGTHLVALLQMAPNPELCVLIRLCQMQMPLEVRRILADHNILKFGVAIVEDARRLHTDYGVEMNGCLDLRYMALEMGCEENTSQGLSLATLSSRFAGYELNKSPLLRGSNWEARRLTKAQCVYAANDAFAGIRIARHFLGTSLLRSLRDSCLSRFAIYVDKPFRMHPAKKKNPSTKSSKPPSSKSKRRTVTRSDQKVYKNAVMKAPDGEMLCNTDDVKVDWYLKMKLATLESEDPPVIRLNFEPRCRAILGGEFYIEEKRNICVVCGADDLLLKKNVVPLEYRKRFPELMKSHTSHDSVLICVSCQHRSTRHDAELRAKLDTECPIDVQAPMMNSLKRAARALKTAGGKLPESRRIEFINLLEDHFREPLSDAVIDKALRLDEQQWMLDHGLTHAQRVVAKYSKTEGLFALESRFRQHFLDTMQPEHLSSKWSVTHNHEAVLMKLATGRYEGPLTHDEFLKVVGASWSRVGEIVRAVVQYGLVDAGQVVVWTEIGGAGFTQAPKNDCAHISENRLHGDRLELNDRESKEKFHVMPRNPDS
ncbi:exonuclease 3'-5' domain-containing protein 2 [Galendromus occidentalis]|uniref:Exonuclease 3'-5' domain-containing protein 2 n=1 Tax=Galendromus occidentalis TaxID=34638 RepID=A0AAJ7L596_9ACAR|nr:exonuclease 3'-5' domain-containing protein 2 [Galendromus occidentalis]